MLYISHPASLEHDPRELIPGHPDTPERLVAPGSGEAEWLALIDEVIVLAGEA